MKRRRPDTYQEYLKQQEYKKRVHRILLKVRERWVPKSLHNRYSHPLVNFA